MGVSSKEKIKWQVCQIGYKMSQKQRKMALATHIQGLDQNKIYYEDRGWVPQIKKYRSAKKCHVAKMVKWAQLQYSPPERRKNPNNTSLELQAAEFPLIFQ